MVKWITFQGCKLYCSFLILNVMAKTKLAILPFLCCLEIVKNSNGNSRVSPLDSVKYTQNCSSIRCAALDIRVKISNVIDEILTPNTLSVGSYR